MWIHTILAGAFGGGLTAVSQYLTKAGPLDLHELERTFAIAGVTTAIGLLLKSPLLACDGGKADDKAN